MSQLALNKYRMDIDGLRAIAVLSVTIFHLNPHWLSGGFLGVDIFFVISGFLITSLLYRDISNDTFSFKTFYMRRIKRILPAFFVVIFVGLALAYTTFMHDGAKEAGHEAFGSVIFLANFVFSLGGGYFDVASEEKLFLHIWSLSIEEQFYFIVPTFLIILIKCGGGILESILYISLFLWLRSLWRPLPSTLRRSAYQWTSIISHTYALPRCWWVRYWLYTCSVTRGKTSSRGVIIRGSVC